MIDARMTIGVFDSGVGGLTVLEHLVGALPGHDFDYFGDTGRAPYGTRSRRTIAHFTDQAVRFLFDEGCALVILACNTASAVALHHLQNKYIRSGKEPGKKLLGIVIPPAEEAVRASKTKRIAVLGTSATVNAKSYEQEIAKLDAACTVRAVACPLLVPLVEEGWQDTDVARLACERYARELDGFACDTILLACTHYPYVKSTLARALPPAAALLEQGPIVAARTVDYLARHPEVDAQLGKGGRVRFFASDSAQRFKDAGQRYYRRPIVDVARVTEEAGESALRVAEDAEFELEVPFGKRS